MNKRMLVLVITLIGFMVLAPVLVLAADVPQKKGYVQDTAGMLTNSGAAEVAKAAAGKPYTFYILTLESLSGRQSTACASCVYQAWKLQANDIIVVLSKNDKRIDMSFNNPQLLSALEKLPADYDGDGNRNESAIDELVGKHFTPQAREGNFSKGILDLIAATNRIGAEAGARGEPSGAASGARSGTALKLVAGAAGAAVLLAAAIRAVTLGRQRRRLKATHEEAGALLGRLNQIREQLEPIASLYEGEQTQRMASELNARIDSGSGALIELMQATEQYRVPFFGPGSAKRSLEAWASQLAALQAEAEELGKSVRHLTELEQRIRRTIQQTKSDVAAAMAEAQEQGALHQLPFEQLHSDLQSLQQRTEEADRLQLHDLVQAEQELAPALQQLAQLKPLIGGIAGLVGQTGGAPERIADARTQVERLLREYGLKRAEQFNPDHALNEAADLSGAMPPLLRSGSLIRLDASIRRVEALLAEAVQQVEDRARLQAETREQLAQLEERLRKLPFSEAQYEAELRKAQTEFARAEWAAIPERHAALQRDLRDIEATVQAARADCEAGAQRYAKAKETLERAAGVMRDAEATAAVCMGVYRDALERLNAHKQTFRAAQARFNEAQSLAVSRAIPERALEHSRRPAMAEQRQAEERLAAKPYDLQQIEAAMASFDGSVQAYASHVRQLASAKDEADRKLRELERRFQQTHSRASGRLGPGAGRYNNHFSSQISDVQKLMAAGQFVEAMSRLSSAERVIAEMQSAYDQLVREEERQRAASRPSSGGDSWDAPGSKNNSRGNNSGGDSW